MAEGFDPVDDSCPVPWLHSFIAVPVYDVAAARAATP